MLSILIWRHIASDMQALIKGIVTTSYIYFFPGRDQYYRRLFFVGLLFREHPKAQPEGGFRRSPGSNLRPLVYKARDLTTAPRRHFKDIYFDVYNSTQSLHILVLLIPFERHRLGNKLFYYPTYYINSKNIFGLFSFF